MERGTRAYSLTPPEEDFKHLAGIARFINHSI
jgi:hypothetical protein